MSLSFPDRALELPFTKPAVPRGWPGTTALGYSTSWTCLLMRFQIRLCSLFQRGWTPPALCRVAVRNSSKFPLNSFPCGFWPWDREATGGICLFRLADDVETKHAPVTGFIDRAFGRSSFKKHKYCSISNNIESFHVFLQPRYLSRHGTSSAISQLWKEADEDFDQIGSRALIWSKPTSMPFYWAQEDVHLPI